MTLSLTFLHHRRGAATVGIAALLIGGVGMAPAVSSTLASRSGTSPAVFSGCLASTGERQVFNVVKRPTARKRNCPAGSTRVHWNAKGRRGATGATGSAGAVGPAGADGTNGTNGSTGPAGADGTNGTNGSTGPAGADGTNGTDGSTGPAGADGTNGTNGTNGSTGPAGAPGGGSMVSSGVLTLRSSDGFPDAHAYLPLSGYLSSEATAPVLAYDAEVIEVAHTSVEQVIAHDVTITDMYANFGSITDLGGRQLHMRLTLLVSSGGSQLLVPAGGCLFDVQDNGPASQDCAWPEDQAVHLTAGDVAVVYVHAYVGGWEPDSPIDIYGTVALTT